MNCLRPEAASEGSFIKISCAQEVSDSLAQMQFIWKRLSSLCLRGEKKKKFYIFLMLFWILFVSFSLPRSPNCSLYMCASSSPPHQLCCILSGFPLPFVFSFSPTSGPTDPNVLVLISFPDWTHFLSWPYFSWPSPSFLYTCPELFSCQTPNRGAVLWKSLYKSQTLEDRENGFVVCCIVLSSYSLCGCQWGLHQILGSTYPENIPEHKRTDAKFQ